MPAKLDGIDANESEEKQRTIKEKQKTGDKNSTEFGFLLCSKAIQYVNPEDFLRKNFKRKQKSKRKGYLSLWVCDLFQL